MTESVKTLSASEILPTRVMRNDLQDLIEAAYNHIVNTKMVGFHSTSGTDMERALLKLPCLYCGGIGLAHTVHCDREFWRGQPPWERILSDFVVEHDERE